METPREFRNVLTLNPLNITGNLTDLVSAEYEVTGIHPSVTKEGTKITMFVALRRGYGYHLSTSYLPTFTLMVIAECTLFFKAEQLETATGFALTIMLVDYTYIQGIYHETPMTSYLKFIDYWLIFCLFMPIGIFLTEVAWLLNRNNFKIISISKQSQSRQQLIIPYQKHAQFIVIAITFLFVGVYTILAIKFFN